MHKVDINGQNYCVGLWWQDLDSGESPRDKIKSILSDFPEFNVYAIRKSYPRQVGFGKLDEPKVPKLPCLAPSLAENVDANSFIGWFRINSEQVWIFALVDNVILADIGDYLGTVEEAEEVFNELQQMADSPWGDEVYIYDDINESLDFLYKCTTQITPKVKIQPTKININKSYAIAFFVALILIVMSFYGLAKYKDYQKKQAQIAEQEAYQEKLNKEKTGFDKEHAQEQYFPEVWNKQPNNQKIIKNCVNTKDKIEISRKGWKFQRYTCDSESYFVKRERTKNGSFVVRPNGYKFDPQKPNEITNRTKFDNDMQTRDEEKLQSVTDTTSYIYEVARRLQAPVSLDIAKLDPVVVEKDNQSITIDPPYEKGNFEIETNSGVLNGDAGILDYPGLVVKSIDYKKEQMTIKGDFYAKN